jgi:hypothetical protein
MKPIPDRAEVSLDFPDKAYFGAFGRAAKFETRATADQVMIKLQQDGEEKRVAEMHLHLALLAAILTDLAAEFRTVDLDQDHRLDLTEAAGDLHAALRGKKKPVGKS